MTLDVPDDPLFTERLLLRLLSEADAEAMWDVLSDEAIYRWIDRPPPTALGDLKARFARISRQCAEGRDDQWLNWTVWRREDGLAIGLVEATVKPDGMVHIAYMFGSQFWGHGYAREAVARAIDAMIAAGALAFEANIDKRNQSSRALAARLGFAQAESCAGNDETWRRNG